MRLYALSLVLGLAYVVSIALGDSWHVLGIAAFILMIVAIVSDRSLGKETRGTTNR